MTAVRTLQRAWIASCLAGKTTHEEQFPGPETELIDCAQEEGVAALLANTLLSNGSGERLPLGERFRGIVRIEAAHELSRFAEIRTVLEALHAAGLQVLLLKGSALAYWLYEQPSHRPRCDVDILVDGESQAEFAVSILQLAGYKLTAPPVRSVAGFETALQRTMASGMTHHIDLHWRFMNHAGLAQGFPFGELWGNSIRIERLGDGARGLNCVYAMVHALLHRVTNFPLGTQDRLIWLYDIHLLTAAFNDADWRDLSRICSEKSILQPCLDGLHACRDAFGTDISVHAGSALAEQTMGESRRLGGIDQGMLDRAHLAALPWLEKVGWVRHKFFPSPEFMRYRYGVSGIAGLSLAYVRRWWVGIKRGVGIE